MILILMIIQILIIFKKNENSHRMGFNSFHLLFFLRLCHFLFSLLTTFFVEAKKKNFEKQIFLMNFDEIGHFFKKN